MALGWLLIGLSWLGGLLSLATSLLTQIENSLIIGPLRLSKNEKKTRKDFLGMPVRSNKFEERNVHSNEKKISVKKARQDIRFTLY